MSNVVKSPVVILAYNRPKYLEKCLRSLKDQVNDREVHLFVNGPRNQQDQVLIQQCVQLGRSVIKDIQIHTSTSFLNELQLIKRGRDFIFEKFDKSFFIFENNVLNSYYLEQVESIYSLVSNKFKKCGIVSAFSGITEGSEVQELRKSELIPTMSPVAYLMTRECYDDIYDELDKCSNIIGSDYLGKMASVQLRNQLNISNKISGSALEMTLYSMFVNGYFNISTFSNNLNFLSEKIQTNKIDSPTFNFNISDTLEEDSLEFLRTHFKENIDYREFEIDPF